MEDVSWNGNEKVDSTTKRIFGHRDYERDTNQNKDLQ